MHIDSMTLFNATNFIMEHQKLEQESEHGAVIADDDKNDGWATYDNEGNEGHYVHILKSD